MKTWLAASAAIVALTGPAFAQQAPAKPAQGARVLYICDDEAISRAEFGKVKFVTAAEALAAGAAWTAPRCITPFEHAKLMRLQAKTGVSASANQARG